MLARTAWEKTEYQQSCNMVNLKIHPTAVVDPGARLGEGTSVWHFTHVCSAL